MAFCHDSIPVLCAAGALRAPLCLPSLSIGLFGISLMGNGKHV